MKYNNSDERLHRKSQYSKVSISNYAESFCLENQAHKIFYRYYTDIIIFIVYIVIQMSRQYNCYRSRWMICKIIVNFSLYFMNIGIAID